LKRSRFTKDQIIGILKVQEAVLPSAEICHKHEFNSPTFTKYKGKYGDMDVADARKLKAPANSNTMLKKRLPELPF
jgi:putative transposase